ncbi:FUSC family protein [Streptomyces brasiliensis]|uniref:Integral membrane bound transporter domain-containing protein n=1 Tax=Streptomyces brasiliensis TaxID=1954 RepID=A0A917NJV2_9ACTN|nr:FUSC family protein [Streptomyces brasiliensis]GGJ03219.1 hypothetical protein GCM10010121_011980 [Streptomyces brasiliensis]
MRSRRISPADPHPGAGADPAAAARLLRRRAGLLTDRRRRPPLLLSELSVSEPVLPAVALAVPALRMALDTGVAGKVTALLALERGHWAAITAAAVLHPVNLPTTAQCAAQRIPGTVVGLLLAFGALAAHLRPVTLAVLIVVPEFLLEYVVARDYTLGVVFLTPPVLLPRDLAAPAPPGELVLDRVPVSVAGITVALLRALLVVHGRAAVRMERALSACAKAAGRAERALAPRRAAARVRPDAAGPGGRGTARGRRRRGR